MYRTHSSEKWETWREIIHVNPFFFSCAYCTSTNCIDRRARLFEALIGADVNAALDSLSSGARIRDESGKISREALQFRYWKRVV